MKKTIFLLVLIAAISVFALSIKRNWLNIPAHWNPWAPLTIDQPINFITKWKLSSLKQAPSKCLQILAEVPSEHINYEPLEDYTPIEECPLTNVVKIKSTDVAFNDEFIISCPLAVAWLMFERQRLQTIVNNILGTSINKINHYGSFACRNINRMPDSPKSEHATASALDIAGFELSDDSTISVLKHWKNNKEPEKSEFLQQFRNAACEFFGTVLGPDYNSSHLNHFHLDNKNTTICR